MSILASGLDSAQKITVIVLCIALIVFLLADVLLVLSLHKQNKRLVRRKESKVSAEKEEALPPEDKNQVENGD